MENIISHWKGLTYTCVGVCVPQMAKVLDNWDHGNGLESERNLK